MVGKQMTPREEQIFNRTGLLLGSDAMRFLSQCRIIIFGVGGVGSWCAESLVRSGVGNITLVDSDTVSLSNINRQAMATMATVGQPKVSALAERLRSINPDCDITERCQTYSSDNAASFNLEEYNCIIDAIDSLEHKLELILHATNVVRQQKERLWEELGDDKTVHYRFTRAGEATPGHPRVPEQYEMAEELTAFISAMGDGIWSGSEDE